VGTLVNGTHLRSRAKMKAGIYRRIRHLCQAQILNVVGGEAMSDPDGLGGPTDELSEH